MIILNNIYKVLYGLSIIECINVTKEFVQYFKNNCLLKKDNNINYLFGNDPYIYKFKKLFIFTSFDSQTPEYVIHEEHGFLSHELYFEINKIIYTATQTPSHIVPHTAQHIVQHTAPHTAVIFHIGDYLIFEKIIIQYNNFFFSNNIILLITINSQDNLDKIKSIFPNAIIQTIKNKGMDVGGFLKSMQFLVTSHYYKTIKFIYKIHTKTNDAWRKDILDPIIKDFNFITVNKLLSENKPLIVGSSKYSHNNCKQLNNIYINEFYERYKNTFNTYFTHNEFYQYSDQLVIDISQDNLNLVKLLNLNTDFYKHYESDLRIYNEPELRTHWQSFGSNEFHRINNPCYIKNYGKPSYFIAGTIFAYNKEYLQIFENINFEYEYDILETGYVINNIPRKTHSWEYLFGLLIYAMGSKIISLDNNANVIEPYDINRFDIDVYKNCNSDLAHLADTDLIAHYQNYGINENRIYSVGKLHRPVAQIYAPLDRSRIAFFMQIVNDTTDNNYRTLLKYINFLIINNIYVDIYFGDGLHDMNTYHGISIITTPINYAIDMIKSYGEISSFDKINYYLGLNAQRSYDFLITGYWKTAESVYLNKVYGKKIVYMIQQEEYLCYPNDINLTVAVKYTYKPEFIYYCFSSNLASIFKLIAPTSQVIESKFDLGADNKLNIMSQDELISMILNN